ncbi:maleylpyruvate isomerase family mycothiol-dependent enzyme [Streptomyces apocyni]|uniref:maleylpyruvate isomerase family mycothiol-dependent enzyme n=1 Tax=Streptomyces apocyni TaxID=2654677 RepID=UPI0012EA0766|nr:maleylpyruvate isomerase family mycothiol-dependent enzyme [Streptomyces apocyni]
MPPAKRRARTYDPAKIRTAVIAQFTRVREAVRTLTDEQLARPTHLGDWTVRALVVHIAITVDSVNHFLDRDEPARQEIDAHGLLFASAAFAERIGDGMMRAAEAEPSLDDLYARTADRLDSHLDAAPGERLLATPAGAITLADYLVTRTVELIVHTDDLNRAAGLDIPYDRQALAACTRLLADALAVKAPGASTEVRVPPYAVVQCVEGPRHTRGTPPNVVETDPLTWIRLATGRTEWKSALDEAKVAASGERADLSALLPLMG